MLRTSLPPDPPQGSEQWLHQLASYYKQLVDYHQRAAQTAARQLIYLEALLGYDPQLPYETISWLTENQGTESPQKSLEQPLSLPQLTSSPPSSPTEIMDGIATLLATERGHAIHIDYIVRKLYGQPEKGTLDSIRAWVRLALENGEAIGKWSAIPDAPECWTLELQELTKTKERELLAQTTLTTREVAQLLHTSPKAISKIKSVRAEQFREGTHYLVDERNWYHWNETGVELLKRLMSKSNYRSKISK